MESTRKSDSRPAGIWAEGCIFHIARFWLPWTRNVVPTPMRSAKRPQSLK